MFTCCKPIFICLMKDFHINFKPALGGFVWRFYLQLPWMRLDFDYPKHRGFHYGRFPVNLLRISTGIKNFDWCSCYVWINFSEQKFQNLTLQICYNKFTCSLLRFTQLWTYDSCGARTCNQSFNKIVVPENSGS